MKIALAFALLSSLLTGCAGGPLRGFIEGQDTPIPENATYVVRSRLTGAPKALRYGDTDPTPNAK